MSDLSGLEIAGLVLAAVLLALLVVWIWSLIFPLPKD